MYMMTFSYQVLSMVALIASVHCYPSGVGLDAACTHLTPQHNVTSQSTSAPYSVTFSASTYTPGGTVAVTLTSSSTGFKGFMIVARRADTSQNQELLGSFSEITNTTRQACAGKALVHSSNAVKQTLKFNWTAPTTPVGKITFRVTYVQTKETFWDNIVSSVLVGAATSSGSGVTIGYLLTTLSAGLLSSFRL